MREKTLKTLRNLVLTGGFLASTVVTAGIVNSAHDFSNKAWSGGKICIVCHAPHNTANIPDGPLWNHDTSVATYTTYTSATMNSTPGQPSGRSKLCLSCHDGTVGIDAYGGNAGTTMMGGGRNLGTNLGNDHPISVAYTTALATADGGLFDPAVATTALGGTIAQDLTPNGTVECSSCHDVHNKYGNTKLMKINNTGSQLCLTCHNK